MPRLHTGAYGALLAPATALQKVHGRGEAQEGDEKQWQSTR